MPSQLVALATQSRNPAEPDELDEDDDEDDDEPADPHMSSRAWRQLALPSELLLELDDDEEDDEDEDDVPRHVPHFAMMLSTALSHFESAGTQTVPATQKNDRKQKANPRK